MTQKQTVRQRKAIKKVYKMPEEVVNDSLYSRAWRDKGSDFSFTRLGLLLLVMFGLTISSVITPFRSHFAIYMTTGVVESWWVILGYIAITAAIFACFIFLNGKIDKAVRARVQARFEELKRDYWEGVAKQEKADERE